MFLPTITILFVVIILLGYGVKYIVSHSSLSLANKSEKKTSTLVATPSPQLTNWKTYTNAHYSFQYPPNLFIYDFGHPDSGVWISDVPDPRVLGNTVVPKGHLLISISLSSMPMPTSFPYQNGSLANTTIKPFAINGYSGIQGKEKTTMNDGTTQQVFSQKGLLKQDLPDEDGVFLANPKGGYVTVFRIVGDTDLFNKILGTFKIN